MDWFTRFLKGLYVFAIMAALYIILAQGHNWFPFNLKEEPSETSYAHSDYFNEWEEGYDAGYLEGLYLIDASAEEAVHYDRKHSGWHPEEALAIIKAYENSEISDEEDYNAAIRCLYYFYEYFYCGMYEDLK
jgi:hypothetical protein